MRLVGWPLLGVLLSSLAYCAASSWLSLMTRRPIVIGIIYILLWEGSIATFAASAAKPFSISAYGRAFVAHAVPQAAAPVAGTVAWAWCWRRWWRLPWAAATRRLVTVELP